MSQIWYKFDLHSDNNTHSQSCGIAMNKLFLGHFFPVEGWTIFDLVTLTCDLGLSDIDLEPWHIDQKSQVHQNVADND